MDFNGKIDSTYNSLNTRIETLGTQVRKLEMQVAQTGDIVQRQEALAREVGVEKAKPHVNAILDDDFRQVVKHEKLGEGDFEVESSMSSRITLVSTDVNGCISLDRPRRRSIDGLL